MPRRQHALLQAHQPHRRDPAAGEAVLLENLGQRRCGPRRGIGLAPVVRAEFARDRLDFDARRGLGRGESLGRDQPVAKEALGEADAADLERLQALWLEAATDDEFGRTAADVDDQARVERARQLVGHPEIDQARFLVPADDVDGKAERTLGLRQKLARVLGHAEGIGGHGAHRRRVQPGEPLAETRQALQRGLHRRGANASLGIETGAETQRLPPGVEAIDLITLDAPDFQAEAVGAQIDDGEQGGGRGGHERSEAWADADGQG